MPDQPSDPQPAKDDPEMATLAQSVQIMTTEHFTLQTARSGTISEANGRTSLFLGAVSSGLVAIAFIGQASSMGEPFYIFTLIVLPCLFFLGIVTFVRILETGIEDISYARGINRIRHYYTEVAPHLRDYFILPTSDDLRSSFQGMAVIVPRWQILLTTAGMVSVVNSAIGGVFTGLVLKALMNATTAGVVIGGVLIFFLLAGLQTRFQQWAWNKVMQEQRVMFPADEDTTAS